MKYSLIEIRPNPRFCEEPWSVRFDNTDKLDRESCKAYTPNHLGFFYFPRKWEAQKAFDILKDSMVLRRQEEIERLQNDIKSIQALKLPEWVNS